ncbi:hypothetical protein BCR33DRAFT_852758 [Rhizoclosmatium globosum]|uniref:RNase III domain-containing protein n=1 Tax=Rhizoclosmatium globosum TaxID=329046 RepID=A0A1Y2C070_9FUNG|nr:hypothetical protein BCR33DRAFT_852758 [Rhizoclosmatium globosum]|eukprot:ORY40432.1 hypothetical protein BCR33DRAFT_852758 [Rhizoclosmatium globosum]
MISRLLQSCAQIRQRQPCPDSIQPTTTTTFTPEETAQLSAFEARSGISFSSRSTLLQALTHKSFKPIVPQTESETHTISDATERNRILGSRLLSFYMTNYLMAKYPVMPAEASSLWSTLMSQIMRWKKVGSTTSEEQQLQPSLVVARVVQALVGSLYKEKGPQGVADFVNKHIQSRVVDVSAHLKLHQNPKGVLRAVLKELKKPSPVSRMLKETGRLSTNPVFIVGVTRACKNALEKHFSKEVKDVQVPLEVLAEENITFLQVEK